MSQPQPRPTSKANLGDLAAKERAARLVGTVMAGRYRVVELLAMGGVGAVYLGEHARMHKQVAIKVLHPDAQSLPDIAARFEREAVAGAHIVHQNVTVATDFGELEDGSYFLVLEYVRGQTLRDVMKRGPLSVGRAVGIAKQLAAALGAAHAIGIIHRDVKPRNVMLVEGDRDTVKLIDFGLAKLNLKEVSAVAARDPMADAQITGTGAVFGTIAYMAPEGALHGMDTVDGRADLYALGLVLYEMLAGKHPFDTVDPVQLFKRHAKSPPPPIATRSPGVVVPPAVEAVVMRLLAKSRDDRYPTAEAVIAALDAAWDGSISPTPSPVTAAAGEGTFAGPSILPPPVNDGGPLGGPSYAPMPPSLSEPPSAPTASTPPPSLPSAPSAGASSSDATPAPVPASAPVPPPPRWPYVAIGAGLAIGAAAIFWPAGEPTPATSATAIGSTVPARSTSSSPPVDDARSAPKPSPAVTSAPSVVASPTASASAAPAMDTTAARVALRKAVAARDRPHALEAFFALAAQDRDAFRDPSLAVAARDLATATALAGGDDADRLFRALARDLGGDGLDVLYEIVRVRGGSKAALMAETALREPGVIDRATPALRVTWALREAPCAEKGAPPERAAADGDTRTLALMDNVVSPCVGPQSEALKAATMALRKKPR